MNKQELIEAVKELPANCSGPRPLIDKLTTVYGYEVEKEKRYRVKFIQTGQHLAKNIYSSGEYFVIKTSAISSIDSFTRKELEQVGFGWVFDCPGIEIEEVEDDTKI